MYAKFKYSSAKKKSAAGQFPPRRSSVSAIRYYSVSRLFLAERTIAFHEFVVLKGFTLPRVSLRWLKKHCPQIAFGLVFVGRIARKAARPLCHSPHFYFSLFDASKKDFFFFPNVRVHCLNFFLRSQKQEVVKRKRERETSAGLTRQ